MQSGSIDGRPQTDSPAAPHSSPALSNHPRDEEIGNLSTLNSALEVARQRANSARIVPQSRFGTPGSPTPSSPVAPPLSSEASPSLLPQRTLAPPNRTGPVGPSPLAREVSPLSDADPEPLLMGSPSSAARAAPSSLHPRPEALLSDENSSLPSSGENSVPSSRRTIATSITGGPIDLSSTAGHMHPLLNLASPGTLLQGESVSE